MKLATVLSTLALTLAGCDAVPVDDGGAHATAKSHSGDTITLSGNAFVFGNASVLLPYATVTIEEQPDVYAVTDLDGSWSISGLPANSPLTPRIEFPNDLYPSFGLPTFQTMHHQTFRSHSDIDRIFFQSVPEGTIDQLAGLIGVTLDPEACQVVTTVAVPEMGGIADFSEYFSPHGQEGIEARLVPAASVPDPVYFNESVLPDLSLTETSGDGGVVWTNVPAGRTYKVKAQDPAGVYTFEKLRVDCQAGRFINASPPNSLIAQ